MPQLSRLVYGTLVRTGVTRIRRRRASEAVVFCFHNVVAPADTATGDVSLHVSSDDFAEILQWISDSYEVVPLTEITDRVARNSSVCRLAALTFDDAYRGVFDYALPELRRRQLPATLFLVTDASDDPAFFWWDQLAAHGMLSTARREECLHACAGDARAILLRHSPSAEWELPGSFLPAPWDHIQASLGEDLTIGSHTVSHRNLAALPADELWQELVESHHRIEERLGISPALISYPYGLHSDQVLKQAELAGYRGGVTMKYGAATPDTSPLGLPRINVPAGITLEALECWAAGYRFRRST